MSAVKICSAAPWTPAAVTQGGKRRGGGAGGVSVTHRSGKNDRRAPLLRRSERDDVVVFLR